MRVLNTKLETVRCCFTRLDVACYSPVLLENSFFNTQSRKDVCTIIEKNQTGQLLQYNSDIELSSCLLYFLVSALL